jgi:molybdate transport system ATP-binding protein
VARALAAEPKLLLLDEPLAALDVGAAPALRQVLATALSNRSAIIVTHELLDALTLADRVAVFHAGRVVETGRTPDVLKRPQHPFTAELAGLNLLTGVGSTDGVRTTEGWHFAGSRRPLAGTKLAAAFRPGAVTLQTQPQAAGRNTVSARITGVEARGDVIRVRAGRLFADIPPGRAAELRLIPGDECTFSVHPTDVELYPLASEESLI